VQKILGEDVKVIHQEIVDGFCKYFEEEKIKRQKEFGFCDKYLESLKTLAKTFDKVESSFNVVSKEGE